MNKAGNLSRSLSPVETETIEEVRELLTRAAQLLRSLGSERERIAWVVEDTLSFLDEGEEDSLGAPVEFEKFAEETDALDTLVRKTF